MDGSSPPTIDIEDLGLDQGAHLLIKRALRAIPVGRALGIRGRPPDLGVHLAAWCRAAGHELVSLAIGGGADRGASPLVGWVVGTAETSRWGGAEQAGLALAGRPGAVVEHPPAMWGVAARGATVEAGSPEFHFALSSKAGIWAYDAARLYAQAVAAQWNPSAAIDWNAAADFAPRTELPGSHSW